MLLAELADLRQMRQRIDVEDRHLRAVSAQDHPDPILLDVMGDDLEGGIALDYSPQAAGEEVLKAGDDDGDRRGLEHEDSAGKLPAPPASAEPARRVRPAPPVLHPPAPPKIVQRGGRKRRSNAACLQP